LEKRELGKNKRGDSVRKKDTVPGTQISPYKKGYLSTQRGRKKRTGED